MIRCVFFENKALYSPIHNVPDSTQQYQNAVTRYKLLYTYDQDSLLHSFQRLDALFKKYNVESQMVPKDFSHDVFYYRDNKQEPLNGLRNTFDRTKLKEKFTILERLFYKPNYLHPSIQMIFITAVVAVWITLFLLFLIWNYLSTRKKNKYEDIDHIFNVYILPILTIKKKIQRLYFNWILGFP
jgi:hypothetical protein